MASSPTLLDSSIPVASFETFEKATVAFSRSPRASVALKDGYSTRFDGWAEIDEALGGAWCADPFVDQLDHFNDAWALSDSSFDPVANLHCVRRLR
jgi:hypothetical protein